MNSSSTFADRQIILRALRRVERRIRANRLTDELTFALAAVLCIPVALKIWDLFFPLSTTAVTTALCMCATAFLVYAIVRISRKGTLLEAAVSIDEKANLYDAMTSASWFISREQSSRWIDAQIEDTARNTEQIDVRRLYPPVIPRTTYLVAVMCAVLAGLNLIPLSLHRNWLRPPAAPAGIPPQPVSLKRPDVDEALRAMAKELQRSEKTRTAAEALMDRQLSRAAEEFRKLAQQMKEARLESRQAMQELQRSLDQASQHSAAGVEQLSRDLAKASEGLKNQNRQATQQALERAAKDIEKLQSGTNSQQAKNAGDKSDQDPAEKGQQKSAAASGQSKEASDKNDKSKSDGTGMDPSASPPRQGERTTLEVQLEQERLAGMPNGGSIPQDIHESSKQQTSRLDYSNVQSELNVGRKDLMKGTSIPWEYRPLVKGYMEAIRPK